MVGITVCYFILTCSLLLWKLREHKKCSYTAIQDGAVFFTLQVIERKLDWFHGFAP